VIALDAGVLACALNRFAPAHARASQVVEDLVNGERPWALPWPVVHEVLDLVTHPHAVARPLRPSEAWGFLGLVVASPAVRMLGPTQRHAEALVEVLGAAGGSRAGAGSETGAGSESGAGHGIPPGLETAAVLREHGVRELLSADPGMRRYGFLTVIDPFRSPAWTPASPPARRYRVLHP